VEHTQQQRLFLERYVVMARADHPLLGARPSLPTLGQLDYVVVRHHTETLRLLERMMLADRIRLSTPHFMVIPAILSDTDLAVLLPLRIAASFAQAGTLRVARPRWDVADFLVGLHWSRRADKDPGNRWLRELAIGIFSEPAPLGAARPGKGSKRTTSRASP
jgi:DNA-binding transcriptional LysR family regulator